MGQIAWLCLATQTNVGLLLIDHPEIRDPRNISNLFRD
jgi:hypothetical protein